MIHYSDTRSNSISPVFVPRPVGNYRIIYRIDDEQDALDILYVGGRRDVYENLRELLATRRK